MDKRMEINMSSHPKAEMMHGLNEIAVSLPDVGPKYTVLGVIGEGGMGIVLRARHRSLASTCAIKLLRLDKSLTRSDVWERFRREAAIAFELSHPNIIRVYDFDIAPDGRPFIVMEHLKGEGLEERLARERIIPIEDTLQILTKVADALDAIHRVGVVHRDLKPSNIFITDDGLVKILDFGISHIEEDKTRITLDGEIVGTLLYMAPEQLHNLPLTHRADIFSLSATALEMLTGKAIVDTSDIRVLTKRMMDSEPFVTTEDLRCLPGHTASAIVRALSKNPEERFNSATAFVRALRDPAEPPLKSAQEISIPDIEQQEKRPSARRKRYLLATAVVIVLTIIAVIISFSRLTPSPSNDVLHIALYQDEIRVNDYPEDNWIDETVPKLIADYLNVDPRVSASIADSSTRKTVVDGRSHVSFRLIGQAGNYSLTLRAEDTPGHPSAWTFTADGPDIESVVETATFHLGEVLLTNFAPMLFEPSCEGTLSACTVEQSAENALTRGLFRRIRRLADGPLASRPNSFAWFVYQYIQCADDADPRLCRHSLSLPASNLVDRASLVEALKLTEPKPLEATARICTLAESDDALVRSLVYFAPGFTRCGSVEQSICLRLDSFFDRLNCLRDSKREDAPAAARRRFDSVMQIDPAHYLLLGVFPPLFEHDRFTSERWITRMRKRFGNKEMGIAKSISTYFLAERDSVEALIWARRCANSASLEWPAMILDGRIKAGIEKGVYHTTSIMGRDSLDFSSDESALRSMLLPIIIMNSAVSATAWIESERSDAPYGHPIHAANTLVQAVAEQDMDICAHPDRIHPFELETKYYCRDYLGLLDVASKNRKLVKGNRGRATAFLLADSLLQTGRIAEAEQLFTLIDGDLLTRAEFPIASILAVERLGTIAEARRDKRIVTSRYRKFLDIWPTLDISSQVHTSARNRLYEF
jgi:serine/threonine protein kinase